ncbi:hypothetical protein KYC5002_29175 [Archangium violaceum]|uniref:hypothetical protein n=1 Tax=Archangium violaceum TaxID=83451 RepID=UPI002B2B694A|nr:hypothetical protein KYC5002_29175 [Archangium gephyra]
MAKKGLLSSRDFSSLSIKDLLEAREAYHVHLAHLDSVVATAIGRYRIRRRDPDAEDPSAPHAHKSTEPRTLSNTVIQHWSWPCVLVFVDQWLTPEELTHQPEQLVPPLLYLPDGRVVPTCVILAERQQRAPAPLQTLAFTSGLVGGGYPALTDVQGRQHLGTFGCLVTDGDSVHALTNRHVVGEPGREVHTLIRGQRHRVGVSQERQVGKRPFSEVYPGWPGSRTYANLDAGLVRLDDVSGWTAQVFGMGELGPLVDLHRDTLSLDLIGCFVRAFGGASGPLEGEIHGLFYRYQSLGGFDYVADLMIGPRQGAGPLPTLPGDSGTLWFFEPRDAPEEKATPPTGARARQWRPIALQWGGHRLMTPGGGETYAFALATNLSSICRALDVELVRDWDTGLSEYWGKVGHYKVGITACGLVSNRRLAHLVTANSERIAVGDEAITRGELPRADTQHFVALADVADLVWRTTRKRDAANHFADMDQPGQGRFEGKTLLELWRMDPSSRTPAFWTEFYESLGIKQNAGRGALPFRVWQIYDAMVGFLREQRVEEYLCAAGILAHYVGDACQPLHVSFLHHGRPGHAEEEDVHAVYETKMLDLRSAELIAGVNARVRGQHVTDTIRGGAAAADAVVRLMQATLDTLPPLEVIEAYNAQTGRQRIPNMWEVLGERTCDCMARGALCLAMLWESAWREGGGTKLAAQRLGPVEPQTLLALYNDPAFLPALWLRDMVFEDEAPAAHRAPAPRSRTARREPPTRGGTRGGGARKVARHTPRR